MLVLIHAIVGSLIGSRFNSVPLIILLAVISHFVLDIIPHWDGFYDKFLFETHGHLKTNKKTVFLEIISSTIAVIFVVWFTIHFNFFSKPKIWIGAVAATIPDAVGLLYFTPFKKNKIYMKYLKFHSKIQRETSFILGMTTQIVLLAALSIIFDIF